MHPHAEISSQESLQKIIERNNGRLWGLFAVQFSFRESEREREKDRDWEIWFYLEGLFSGMRSNVLLNQPAPKKNAVFEKLVVRRKKENIKITWIRNAYIFICCAEMLSFNSPHWNYPPGFIKCMFSCSIYVEIVSAKRCGTVNFRLVWFSVHVSHWWSDRIPHWTSSLMFESLRHAPEVIYNLEVKWILIGLDYRISKHFTTLFN